MGLFDKKNCDICGKQIGLLGNRKLADGNCCKDCAAKLSPYFHERKQSTVEDIKKQLAYRAQNLTNLDKFMSTATVGNHRKVVLDEVNKRFVVTPGTDLKKYNPDILEYSMVKELQINVSEDAEEIYDTDKDGNEVSFEPAKYEYEYRFDVKLVVNHPYIDQITFELSDGGRPDSPYSDEYKELERQANVLMYALTGKNFVNTLEPTFKQETEEENKGEELPEGSWKCECGAVNTSKFCTECGKEKPSKTPKFCPECGTELKGAKFCPECGHKVA